MSQKNFMSYGDAETVLSRFAQILKALDPEGGNLDTRLTAVENELYSHFTINAYNATVIKISGFKANASSASGETFVLRQRGAEAIILTFGNNTQDTILGTNYRAVRLYGGIGGTSKITNLQFDYTNRDLYVTVGGFGALSFSQIGGQKDALTYETGATVPETGVYNISVVDIATLTDLDAATADEPKVWVSAYHSSEAIYKFTVNTSTQTHFLINAGYGGDILLGVHTRDDRITAMQIGSQNGAVTGATSPTIKVSSNGLTFYVRVGSDTPLTVTQLYPTKYSNATITMETISSSDSDYTSATIVTVKKALITSDLTATVTSGSMAPITSGGVYTETRTVSTTSWTDSTTNIRFTAVKKNGWCMINTDGTSGSVVSNGSPVYAGQIPSGYRPSHLTKASGVYGDANTCAIVIDTDGTIRYGSWSENKTLSNVYWQAVYPCED